MGYIPNKRFRVFISREEKLQPDISNWDTSSAYNENMFKFATHFNQFLGLWDVTNVAGDGFEKCFRRTHLTMALNLSHLPVRKRSQEAS